MPNVVLALHESFNCNVVEGFLDKLSTKYNIIINPTYCIDSSKMGNNPTEYQVRVANLADQVIKAGGCAILEANYGVNNGAHMPGIFRQLAPADHVGVLSGTPSAVNEAKAQGYIDLGKPTKYDTVERFISGCLFSGNEGSANTVPGFNPQPKGTKANMKFAENREEATHNLRGSDLLVDNHHNNHMSGELHPSAEIEAA